MTLQVTSVNVNSGQGVAISVTGIAQVSLVLELEVDGLAKLRVANCNMTLEILPPPQKKRITTKTE